MDDAAATAPPLPNRLLGAEAVIPAGALGRLPVRVAEGRLVARGRGGARVGTACDIPLCRWTRPVGRCICVVWRGALSAAGGVAPTGSFRGGRECG
ncbi:hypothetical protein GCM10023224_06290 [Streptomonospora halophila]|uniref:Uncharacterized protein n=1 Tax=Streptomonospora halophila TaxID=427369 RepID=A0ABP9G936_9ACTN